jgi:hypothetical protein
MVAQQAAKKPKKPQQETKSGSTAAKVREETDGKTEYNGKRPKSGLELRLP